MTPTVNDRLAARERPGGSPVMYQSWADLLFMHWRVSPAALRPLLPERLEIDTFEGEAWVGVTPFTLWGVRPVLLPALPFVSEFHEINVRTYVHLDGVPGVWFFSLDANSAAAVAGARTLYHLPYFNAEIALEQQGRVISYDLSRTGPERGGEFHASWRFGEELPPHEDPASLEFFLVERYCLYSARGDRIFRARINHRPWPLRAAELLSHSSDIAEEDGVPPLEGDPLVHYAEALKVDVWPVEEV